MIRKLFLLLLIPAGAVAADAGEIPARQDGVVGDPVERCVQGALDNPDVEILLGQLRQDPKAREVLKRFNVGDRGLSQHPEIKRIASDPRQVYLLDKFENDLVAAGRRRKFLVAKEAWRRELFAPR